MDINASFSQIFEERTFGKLNPEEMNLFMSQRTFESHCNKCQKTVTSNMRLFLIYVSNASLKQTGFDPTSSPLFVSQIFMRPRKLVCKHCSESVVSDTVCKSAVNSNFVFIEFLNEIMNCVTIHEETELNNSPYSLQGLVRCYQRHFTCSIKMEGKWVYFDDMWSTVQLFSSLQELKQHYPVGWFFTIFQLKHTSTSRPTETNLDSSLKRKISHDEISSYQKIQSNVANNLTATEKEITEHNFRTKEVDLNDYANMFVPGVLVIKILQKNFQMRTQ
jgi:hypothetical protein